MLTIVTETFAIIALGIACSSIGVVVYWPFENTVALVVSVAVMALLGAIWLFICTTYALDEHKRGSRHSLALLVYLVVSFSVGFAIPLVLTKFGTDAFRVESTHTLFIIAGIVVGAVIFVREWRNEPGHKRRARHYQ